MILATLMLLVAPDDPTCRHIGGALTGVRFDRDVLRPGDEVGLAYVYRDGPDGEKVIPQRCITALAVKGPARLRAADRLRVDPSAKQGEAITLSMRIGGLPFSRTLTVVGRDQQVLTGTWHVAESTNCRGRLPAEVRFFANGNYDFTYPDAMIETMTSGGGSFSWDQASGALSLGNGREGRARIEGKRIVMEVRFPAAAGTR